MNRDPEKLGTALRQWREEAGLTARDVAAKAGFSPSYLSELEKGTRRVSDSAMEKIAPAFGQELADFREGLAKRAERIREDAEGVRQTGERIHGTSSRLHDAGLPYRVMNPSTPDADVLLRHLVANMSRDQMFVLLTQFMEEAKAGDIDAFAKARALFDLIPPEVIAVPVSSSG